MLVRRTPVSLILLRPQIIKNSLYGRNVSNGKQFPDLKYSTDSIIGKTSSGMAQISSIKSIDKSIANSSPVNDSSKNSRKAEESTKNIKWKNRLLYLSIGVAMVTIGVNFYPLIDSWYVLQDLHGYNLSKRKPSFSSYGSTYVERPNLEKDILFKYNTTELDSDPLDGSYYFVSGPYGAGKSTLVGKTLHDKVGVINIHVALGDDSSIILERMAMTVTGWGKPNREVFKSVLRKARQIKGSPATIVMDVDRSADETAFLHIQSITKSFAEYANIIIILSDPNALDCFRKDRSRQEIIWVDEMNLDEARQYAEKKGISMDSNPEENRRLLEEFFAKVGSLPVYINKLSDKLQMDGQTKENMYAVMNEILQIAEGQLSAFIHTPILQALKKSPNGVPAKKFVGMKHKGVRLHVPDEVVPPTNHLNAVMYHPFSHEYRLVSTAHRTALKTY